jgi:hypothetical protein
MEYISFRLMLLMMYLLGDKIDTIKKNTETGHRKKCFQLFCVLMKAVGFPVLKLKESSHYVSLVRLVIRVLRSEIPLNC